MSNFKLTGLCAASFSPFHDNGDLDLSRVKPYIESLLADGVKSVYVCGNAGECFNMTVEERKQLAEKWVAEGKDKMDAIVIHVTCSCLRHTLELAKHAQSIGASAIAVLPPPAFRPGNIDQLVDYVKAVGEAAPNLPLYYYHSSSYKGGYLSMVEFLDAAHDKIPTLHGIKFEEPNIFAYGEVNEKYRDKYQICIGRDEYWLPSLSLNARDAVIGGVMNYCGKPCNKILEAYQKTGDVESARKEFYKILALFRVMNNVKGIDLVTTTTKYLMALSRLDLGPCRPPNPRLTAEQKESIKKELQAIGFFDWIS